MLNNQEQVPKDIEAIKSIYSIFKTNLSLKDSSRQYYNINDKLKLLEAPHWFYASVDLASEQPDKRASLANTMEKTFDTLLPAIYKEAIARNDSDIYSDPNIWKYFNEYITDDLDKDAQNTLFIITDGYMDLKKTGKHPAENNRHASCTEIIDELKIYPDWDSRFTKGDYGLFPIQKKISNLQVILLQVNPKTGWVGEYDLLAKIWGKWFTEMGVSNYHFIKDDSISGVKRSIAKLMNVKINEVSIPKEQTAIITKDSSKNQIPVVKTEAAKIKEPIIAKEKQATILPPTVVNVAPEKKKNIVSKNNTTTARNVLPPDESDTRLLNTRKTDTSTANAKDDNILQDAGATNGFNTGIRQKKKKEKS